VVFSVEGADLRGVTFPALLDAVRASVATVLAAGSPLVT
jgi:hypothetical protein